MLSRNIHANTGKYLEYHQIALSYGDNLNNLSKLRDETVDLRFFNLTHDRLS
jgi:hypothetical protein